MRLWSCHVMFLGLLILSLSCPLPAEAKEGFGTKKLTVKLARVRPPDVYISGTRITVRASPQGTYKGLELQLITALGNDLLGNDSRLTQDDERPQTVIEIAVLENNFDEGWENRTESRRVKVGTDSKGKPQYTTRLVQVRYKVIHQVFSTSYRVEDLVDGAVLDADNIVHSIDEDYREGNNAPTATQLEQDAIAKTVAEIAQRLSPTTEWIGVLLPKGSLKENGNLAKAGLWDRYLEALEGQSPRSKPRDESYRQYALGAAYEALGYSAEQPGSALSYLEQAALHYNEALRANPTEKYFIGGYKSLGLLSGLKDRFLVAGHRGSPGESESTRKRAIAPLERVKTAMAQYQKVMDYREFDQHRTDASEGAKALSEDDPGEVLDNEAIIEMTRAGLVDEIILTTVNSAGQNDFDVSPTGLVELAKAEVSNTVIQRLQAIASSRSEK